MVTTSIITKSYFTRGDDCPLATAYSLIHPFEASAMSMDYVFDNGHKVGELARKLFPGGTLVDIDKSEAMASATTELIAQGAQIIYEASFLNDGLYASVDILLVNPQNHVEIYEVKSSTEIKDTYYRDVAFQTNLVQSCGFIVDKTYIVIVNEDFVKNGEIDPKLFFIVTDVTDNVTSLIDTVKNDINEIRVLTQEEDLYSIEPLFGTHCFSPYSCPYWKLCKSHLPEKSIFEIYGGMRNSTKLKLYNSGIEDMAAFLKLNKQNPKYVQQARIEVQESDAIEVNDEELKSFIKEIQFPITSLDFETIIPAIPVFDGMKPYEQSVTQFSMHVLKHVGGSLEHHEFLANPNEDWREKLAHQLAEKCPTVGSVIVWNKTMEYNRIIELAEMDCNSDIKDKFMSIAERIVDLMVPFRNRVVYNRPMHGSYSLKHVLPALCPNDKDLNYSDLSINNGMIASQAFTQMMDGKMSEIQVASTRRNLLTYCELDTYGPFHILSVMMHLADGLAPILFVRPEKHDNANRTLHVGNRVSTNVGLGTVTGFTRCFVRVLCDDRVKRLRKPYNLFNLSGLDVSDVVEPADINTGNTIFYDVTGKEVKVGDFVVTKSKLGKVIGNTSTFLKIQLTDGTVVLRNGTFTIIS